MGGPEEWPPRLPPGRRHRTRLTGRLVRFLGHPPPGYAGKLLHAAVRALVAILALLTAISWVVPLILVCGAQAYARYAIARERTSTDAEPAPA